MSRTVILGVALAVLIGYIAGFALIVYDGAKRLLCTDRDWPLAARFQDDPANVDPLGY